MTAIVLQSEKGNNSVSSLFIICCLLQWQFWGYACTENH